MALLLNWRLARLSGLIRLGYVRCFWRANCVYHEAFLLNQSSTYCPGVFMKFKLALTAAALTLSVTTFAQTKWDLPSAYPATNFHTENLVQFAADVDKATAGKLKITVHPGASLFKAPEIKRAVQANQAQAGEILLANFQNEWQIFGADEIGRAHV